MIVSVAGADGSVVVDHRVSGKCSIVKEKIEPGLESSLSTPLLYTEDEMNNSDQNSSEPIRRVAFEAWK
jgi:hypothetical protein